MRRALLPELGWVRRVRARTGLSPHARLHGCALAGFACALACNLTEAARLQPSASGGTSQPAASPAAPAPGTGGGASSTSTSLTSASSTGAGAAPSAPPPSERCVVPLSQTPAPRARPAERCPAAPGPGPGMPKGRVVFVDTESHPQLEVERALTDEARSLGLMYRTQLGRDAGMIFSWDEEETRSFWMLNTCLPLDMLFIAADGTIVGILEQVPTLNTLPRSVPCPAQHVLEVNAGWVREHGVRAGQHVQLET